MLHEKVRLYKKELHEAHATHTVHEKHITRLQSEIKRLHETFQVCSSICLVIADMHSRTCISLLQQCNVKNIKCSAAQQTGLCCWCLFDRVQCYACDWQHSFSSAVTPSQSALHMRVKLLSTELGSRHMVCQLLPGFQHPYVSAVVAQQCCSLKLLLLSRRVNC